MADLDRVIYELTDAGKTLPAAAEKDEDIRYVLSEGNEEPQVVRAYLESDQGPQFDDDKVCALIECIARGLVIVKTVSDEELDRLTS